MHELVGPLIELAEKSVSAGYVVALALVCLLQYALYLYRLSESRRRDREHRRELDKLDGQLRSARRETYLHQVEAELLREFLGQPDAGAALDRLLRHFLPNAKSGLAAFLLRSDGRWRVFRSRGLSLESRRQLSLDAPLVQRLAQKGSLTLRDAELFHSDLLRTMARRDRRRTHCLHLLTVGDPQQPQAVLVTSRLIPSGVAWQRQLSFSKRLLNTLAGHLRYALQLREQTDRLRLTRERLELRAILDRTGEPPLAMMEAFLNRLAGFTGADRVAVFLANADSIPGSHPPLIRAGASLPPGVRSCWERYEDRLAHTALTRGEPLEFDAEDLRYMGIDTLLGRALLLPLSRNKSTIGVVALLRRAMAAFTEEERLLAAWASEQLSHTLLRVLDQATVQRAAHTDGLTGLGNRRTFDAALESETNDCRRSGRPCSLLLLDLDRFKRINDGYGHQAGDEVLRLVARVIQDQIAGLRSGDRAIAARYGGEEIAILMPGMPIAGAARIAESIRAAVEKTPVAFQGRALNVTLSVGVATLPDHAADAQGLLAAADAALYHAKRSGRNRVCRASETKSSATAETSVS